MRRREFIVLLGSAVTLRPLGAASEPTSTTTGRVYRIAIVVAAGPHDWIESPELGQSFFAELRRLGYVEGRNLAVDLHPAEGHPERYPDLALEVIDRNPDVIFSETSRLAIALQAATGTIPIVTGTADPIGLGLAASLSHPGGNITGVSVDAGIGIWGKRLELLREAAPKSSRIGFLGTRAVWEQQGRLVREVIQRDGMTVVGPPLDTPLNEAEYRRIVGVMVQSGADSLIVHDQPENITNRQLICRLAEEAYLPAVYPYRTFVEVGGLIAYTADLGDLSRHAADQVDLIFKGAKPRDIPFYQASKFELSLNLRTAKALGLTIPNSLLAQADKVIE